MLTQKEAESLALKEVRRLLDPELLDDPSSEPVILEEHTIVKPYGWVFLYNSRAYLETRDVFHGLAGNGPVVVEHSGRVHLLGTEASPEELLRALEDERGLRG